MKFFLLVVTSLLFACRCNAQANPAKESLIPMCLHIEFDNGSSHWMPPSAYILRNIDTAGNVNWQSAVLTNFKKEEHENLVFIMVRVPESILKNSKGVWCTAIAYNDYQGKKDTLQMDYGGVVLSKINLCINSEPQGAEVYLIPNRVWMEEFENKPLDKMEPQLRFYLIDNRKTNTTVKIDETVYVVVCKLGGKYTYKIHRTNPYNVEPTQTVTF